MIDGGPVRCAWADGSPLMLRYHDQEWGVPSHDDRHLFEMLILEGAQAGLSWRTILDKREGYRRAFADFDPEAMARFTPRRIESLLRDPGIVRNRLKVQAAVTNARAFLTVVERDGSFGAVLWALVGGRPRINRWRTPAEVPAATPQAEHLSRALRGLGFKFVGPTICYAFMQAVGMVNDHTTDCFRHRELTRPR